MRKIILGIAVVGLQLTFSCFSIAGLELDRTPYVQGVGPNRTVIMWRTNDKSTSVVQIRKDDSTELKTFNKNEKTKQHEVEITNLTPNTRYFYRVGSKDKLLNEFSEDFSFKTAPATESQAPLITVWILGDPGTGDKAQKNVRDAFLNDSHGADLILTSGDNAYNDGKDKEFQEKFFNVYEQIFAHTPVWPSHGNHARNMRTYRQQFALPTDGESGGLGSGTEDYYSFDYGNAHFVSLDSDDSFYKDTRQARWLEQDLKQNKKQWTIVFFHHAPYSKGTHDSDDDGKMSLMRQNALPILEAGGVDLVLGGHSHSYERSVLLNGHYGKEKSLTQVMILNSSNGNPNDGHAYTKQGRGPIPNSGTVYQLIGTSGRDNADADLKIDHKANIANSGKAGSVVLHIRNNSLESRFVSSDEQTLDRFVIVKQDRMFESSSLIQSHPKLSSQTSSP